MYYGINAKSHNMIMLDRKQARCPNGLKLGTPGSGKSMSCKSEIVGVFLTTADDILFQTQKPSIIRWSSGCMGRSSNFRPPARTM